MDLVLTRSGIDFVASEPVEIRSSPKPPPTSSAYAFLKSPWKELPSKLSLPSPSSIRSEATQPLPGSNWTHNFPQKICAGNFGPCIVQLTREPGAPPPLQPGPGLSGAPVSITCRLTRSSFLAVSVTATWFCSPAAAVKTRIALLLVSVEE